jgi:hypothetical protein
MCAVCDEANDQLVLTAGQVEQLLLQCNECVPCDNVNTGSLTVNTSNVVSSAVDELDLVDELTEDVTVRPTNTCNIDCDSNATVDPDVAPISLQSDDGLRRASIDELIAEQHSDDTLRSARSLAQRGKGGFFYKDGLLMHKERILGQEFTQLCLPLRRRTQVLELGHELGAHLGPKKTSQRIRMSFYWTNLTDDCKKHCKVCEPCQKKARVTFRDRVPITPIPRADCPFTHWFLDVLGPVSNVKGEFNYCVVMVDSATRYPAAFALRTVTAKNVCNCLMSLFETFGVASAISTDNAHNLTSKLQQEFYHRLGCSPRFNSPYHPESTGLVERMIGTVKLSIAKMAADHPKQWHKYLGFVLWALREVPNETTGVAPWMLAFGRLPRGPLAVLKETWCGERDFPLDFGKTPVQYLKELHEKLEIANCYAKSHTERAQQGYAAR